MGPEHATQELSTPSARAVDASHRVARLWRRGVRQRGVGSRTRGVRRGSPRPRAHRQQRHAPGRAHPRGAVHRSRVACSDERLRGPASDRGLGDRAPRPRSGPLRRVAALDAPWAVGDGSEPRPHLHAPRRLRSGSPATTSSSTGRPRHFGDAARASSRVAPPGSSSRARRRGTCSPSAARRPAPRSSSHHHWCSGTSSIACSLEETRRCSPSWRLCWSDSASCRR